MTVQDASDGDTATLPETLVMAAEQVEAMQLDGAGVEKVVADKGYHSDDTLVALDEIGVRSHVSEPERGRRCWQDKKTGETPPEKRAAQKASYANRRRVRGRQGRRSRHAQSLIAKLPEQRPRGSVLIQRSRSSTLTRVVPVAKCNRITPTRRGCSDTHADALAVLERLLFLPGWAKTRHA